MRSDATEAVIFDLGGVLIDWNPRHLYRRMLADEQAMERFLAEVCTPEWNLGLDAGRPFAEGVAELCARFPDERPLIEAWRERWIEMIGGPIHGTVTLLEELDAAGVPLYALTNWSAETFPLVDGDPAFAFLRRFAAIFVSGRLGMVKPHAAIYRHALEAIGRPAARCLFIDDSAANVAGAEAVGLAAHRFTSPAALRTELAGRGLLRTA
ncbi:HAD family hydrolase [Marinimicrococcus flavescens]|uniref:HAD family phosphatase n=1 Tax=Marinimicrococcus flavescens TaxID=3031815 RepID=A0AAP3V1W5_9PROT|nr:HAD family phosphatase [Marinimicrococcus flavescens]